MKENRRMLIVDEDAAQAEFISKIARDHGFEPEHALDGAAFRDIYTPDTEVIVLDLMLTRVDGIEILRELADLECEAAIIISGDADRRILNAAERLGRARQLRIAGTLPKPVEELLLRRLLDGEVVKPGADSRRINVQVAQTELLQCMEDGCIDVLFQPKVNVRSLEFVSVEALVRLQHPTRGILQPQAFLAMAEESGLINRMTRSVLLKALEQAAEWQNTSLPLDVAVNISPLLLTDLALPEMFSELTSRFNVEPGRVILEITESWLSEDALAALDILTRLRMQGFQLSIDDFGTGYSTMAQLNELPYNEMKLDQTFVRNAAKDREARAIVESSIELGHKLGMKVVAEGVERQEDWDLISELMCDEGQGFFIARPMRSEEVPAWLRHWNTCLGRD